MFSESSHTFAIMARYSARRVCLAYFVDKLKDIEQTIHSAYYSAKDKDGMAIELECTHGKVVPVSEIKYHPNVLASFKRFP